MLPESLRGPPSFFDEADFKRYLAANHSLLAGLDREFVRQVLYDLFENFNVCYPWFDITGVTTQRRVLSAAEVRDQIRYFADEDVSGWWSQQFDKHLATKFSGYVIFDSMIGDGTWPFPPIVLENQNGQLGMGSARVCGRPLHLVEGTHRVSYLTRMLELGMIEPDSTHEVVVIVVNV